MKRLLAIIIAAVLLGGLLCACGGSETLTVDPKFVGAYSFSQSTMSENAIRTVTLYEDGTYTYSRLSDYEGRTGEFTGTWGVNSKGVCILTADISGKTSEATMRSDGRSLNMADIGRDEDTVGDGIYFRIDN